MKVHYFYLSQGVTRGPLTQEEVVLLIQGRQLHGLDLVLKETSKGIEDWKPLNEMTEFAAAFKEVIEREEPLDWVVLVRRGRGQYLQNGPFSTKDIRSHLSQGRLRYSDYAWKKGLSQWTPLSQFSEFKSKKKTPDIGKIDPIDIDEKDLLPDIPKVTYAKKSSASFNPNPFWADQGEQVEVKAEAPPKIEKNVTEKSEPIKKVEKKQNENEESAFVENAKSTVQNYLRPFIFEKQKKSYWVLSATLAMLIGVLWALYQAKHKRLETAVVNVEQKANKTAPSVPLEKPQDEEVVVVEREEKKVPTQIGFSTEKDFILIQSNGSRHYPIKVLVVGLPGQLQEGKVWFKSLVTRPNKGNASVSLSDLDLVPGTYRIRISTETGLKIERDLAYETSGNDYLKLRNRNRKEQSYWYNQDRMRLILRVSKLRDVLWRYAQQKEANFASLREKDKNPEKVFYFEWERYTELKSKVLRLSQKSRSLVQAGDLEALKVEVDSLSQRLGLLSVWR